MGGRWSAKIIGLLALLCFATAQSEELLNPGFETNQNGYVAANWAKLRIGP
jgi:hypothetical protein